MTNGRGNFAAAGRGVKVICQNFFGCSHAGGNVFLRDRAGIFSETECVQFEVLESFEPGEFQSVPRAVQRAAVNRQDALRGRRLVDQRLHPAANAREAGHLRRAFAREPAGDAVGQLARVRTSGAGIDHRGFFCRRVRAFIHNISFVITMTICPNRRREGLTQVNEL